MIFCYSLRVVTRLDVSTHAWQQQDFESLPASTTEGQALSKLGVLARAQVEESAVKRFL